MRALFNTSVSIVLLVSLFVVMLFGPAAMAHEAHGASTGVCPFSALSGGAACPQEGLAIVIHHSSAYRTFLATPALSILFIAEILLAAIAVVLALDAPVLAIPAFARVRSRGEPPLSSFGSARTRWLSLLEHSPSAS